MKTYTFANSCLNVSFILVILLFILQAELLQIFKWKMATFLMSGDIDFMLEGTYSCEWFHPQE